MEFINDKIKKLKKEIKTLEQEMEKEINIIKTYSTYDRKLITLTMYSLIYTFEGNDFSFERVTNPVCNTISINIVNASSRGFYKDICFSFKDNFVDEKGQQLTLLVPDKYLVKKENIIDKNQPGHIQHIIRNKNLANSRLIIPVEMNKEDLSYIEDFIDKLFEYRMKNNLIDITKNQLIDFLHKYYYDNQNMIKTRNIQKAQYINQEIEKYKIMKYQEKCMIERKPFIDLVINLINNDNNTTYTAQNEVETKSGRHVFSKYNGFRIVNNKVIICSYKSLKYLVTSSSDTEDDEDNMDKFINFYDFIKAIEIVIKEIPTLKLLLDELETIYQEKTIIDKEDINNVYKYISTNNKGYTLIKENTNEAF